MFAARALCLACLACLAATIAAADEAKPATDHVIVLKGITDAAAMEAALAVMASNGVSTAVATPLLNAVRGKGEGVVAQGPKHAMERIQKEFAAKNIVGTVMAKAPPSEYAGSDVLDVDTAEQLEALLSGREPLVINFYGSSCPHCHAMVPEYKAAATALKGRVRFHAINLQAIGPAAQDVAARLSIGSFPTVRFIRGGDHLQHDGPRQRAELIQFAEKALAKASGEEVARLAPAGPVATSEAAAGSKAEESKAESSKLSSSKAAEQPEAAKPPASKLAQSKVNAAQQAADAAPAAAAAASA